MSKELASALRDTLISPNVSDANGEAANMVDVFAGGLDQLASEIRAVGIQLKYLGTGDNGSPMGAIEFHGVCVKEAGENIADAIRELAAAIAGCRSMGSP